MNYHCDETINQLSSLPESGEYENCTFVSCDFQEADFRDFLFVDCRFQDCNLSNSQLKGAGMQGIEFHSCKLMGIHWEDAKEFGLRLRFESCLLNHSSFFQMKLSKTLFRDCDLSDCDFTGSDLKESVFTGSRMLNAQMEDCGLEKCDFRNAISYRIHPDQNKIKGARFSRDGIEGLLGQYGIVID